MEHTLEQLTAEIQERQLAAPAQTFPEIKKGPNPEVLARIFVRMGEFYEELAAKEAAAQVTS